MKPNFALNVTDDSLGLLHRTRAGWVVVGETRFDRDDLDLALGFLQSSATELAPKGVTTKIVIPNSQILYMDIAAPGLSDAARRTQIAAALEGRTPYGADELVFDWSGDGDVVQVAVLARETLEQAEGFLAPHGFNAVSFVAIPPEGAFGGEPWFGLTAAATGILGKGKSVTRDTDVIRVLAAAAVPVQAEEPEPVLAPVAERVADVAQPEPEPARDVVLVADPIPAPFQEAAGFVAAPVVADDAPVAGDIPVAVDVGEDPVVILEPVAEAVEDVADEAPFTHVADAGIADVPAADVVQDDLPPAPSQAALIAFASRRSQDTGARPLTADAAKPAVGTPMPGLVAERLAARAQALAEAGAARAPAPARGDMPLRDAAAFVTAPTLAGPAPAPAKKRKGGPAPTVMAAAGVNDLPARKPLTKPGGTFATSDAARGKPRFLGLILTGILLLFLALVAAWSSFFLASRGTDAPQTDVAAADAPADAPAVDDEMLADAQDPADFDAPVAETVATVAPVADAVPAAEVAPEPTLAAGPAPDAGVDATLPLATAPDAAQDEIVLSTMDGPPVLTDATALADPVAEADAPPTAQMPPPPFGTVYQFDAAGFIIPTAEGIVTPEGVRLVAGPPARVPPLRPATIAAQIAAAATVVPIAPATPALTDPAATFAADPALANARPRVRPAGLVPAGAADDAALAADAPVRTTSLIPRARPAGVVAVALAAGEEARLATEAASLAASTAVAAASEAAVLALVAPEPDASASPMAVSVSRVPAPRPRDLEKAVAAAVAAASQPAPSPAPEPEPAPQRQAAVEPEAEEEPEVAAAAPARPTGRTVAEQATFVNAISLNRINLIGVYGTQSNRYALIRQANGRYKKVSVGDRIDGGTVAAITNDEVRYQKGGRMIALEMPRG